LYHRDSLLEPEAHALADHPRHDRRGIAATQQVVAQARRHPGTVGTLERLQTSERDGAGALELAVVTLAGQRRVDQRRLDAPRPELGAKPRGPVAARRARGDPVAGERFVVEVAARGEIGDDLVRDIRGRAAPAQARGEVACGPRVT